MSSELTLVKKFLLRIKQLLSWPVSVVQLNLFHITLPHHFKTSLISSYHLRYVFEVTSFPHGYTLKLMIIHHRVELPIFILRNVFLVYGEVNFSQKQNYKYRVK